MSVSYCGRQRSTSDTSDHSSWVSDDVFEPATNTTNISFATVTVAPPAPRPAYNQSGLANQSFQRLGVTYYRLR
jgi:hypothetical protein